MSEPNLLTEKELAQYLDNVCKGDPLTRSCSASAIARHIAAQQATIAQQKARIEELEHSMRTMVVMHRATSGDTEWEKKVAEFEVAKQRLAKLEADEAEVTRLRARIDLLEWCYRHDALITGAVFTYEDGTPLHGRQVSKPFSTFDEFCEVVAALAGKGE